MAETDSPPVLRRPLRVDLHPDDVLFFIHLEKTGGTSLISILERRFPPEQVFPLHSAVDEKAFLDVSPQAIAACRFVRGHYRFGAGDRRIHSYVCQHPILATVLRDPVARTVSHYRHVLRNPQARFHNRVVSAGITLRQFVESGEFDSAIVNLQTRYLAGSRATVNGPEPADARLSDAAQFFLAREKLEHCVFVGITERFADSLQLLAYTFGWETLVEERLNQAPDPVHTADLEEETRALIDSKTVLDCQLYAFAQDLFGQRWAAMVREKTKRKGRR